MTCRDLIAFLMDYLLGELSPSERASFEAHLAECPDCVAYLNSYQQSVTLGKAAFCNPDDALPADVPNELVQAILASRASS